MSTISNTNITYIAGIYGYITDEGEYAQRASMTLIDPALLTDKQWENVGEIDRYSRQDYILAIIHGDTVNTAAIEKDNEL